MAEVDKQDSNFTELRYAVEETPGVLPGSPVWRSLEPNSYKDFGGDVKTKARRPISGSRQRKKGVVVDLDAAGGFDQDVTPTNMQDIMQSFMFADLRTKSELDVAIVDNATDSYQPASGGTGYFAGDLFFAKDFSESENNGLKLASGNPNATHVYSATGGMVDESGASGIISRVGVQLDSGITTIDANGGDGGIPRLAVANVSATDTLTGDGTTIADTETVTIGGIVYTFQASLTAGSAGNVHVHVGAAAATLTNLFHAINNTGGTAGTDYSTVGTGANTYVSATNPSGTTVVVTSRVTGTPGNLIAVSELSAHASWGTATLAGGVGRDLSTLGILPGETIYIGGDQTAERFAIDADEEDDPGNNGYARAAVVATSYLDLDKTQFEMQDDAGSAKTIRIFFGRVLKNESSRSLIVKKPVQLERTVGSLDDSLPDEVQAEYITRAYGNTGTLDAKTADIVTFDMAFVGGTHETVDGATVPRKSGSRPDLDESDAFNSTSDVSHIKMAIIDSDSAYPDPLFAFLTDFKLMIKNNLKQNKAIKVLGAFDVTPGVFEVAAEVNAYFVSVASVEAVKANADVTLDVHFAKDNKGISFDLPLTTLSKARLDVKIDEAIMLPSTADAASGKSVRTSMDHTLFVVFFDYLPDAAEA